jgi:hypothetical protein
MKRFRERAAADRKQAATARELRRLSHAKHT